MKDMKTVKITLTITKEHEKKLRRCNRKKGDMSRIVNDLTLEQLTQPTD